tara:strand:- start:11973 stop:13931 length:1959 start_codon:yes stop_codon:yes gene_type:complete
MELIQKIKGPLFEKVAAKILLGDNPATYPSELIANLYKQHPYLGKYQVNISIEGQDPSMGYMYGVFMVTHASDVPPEPGVKRMGEVISQGQAQAPDPAKAIRIPIIVENKRAYSFDVFISPDGRFMPLNESRVSSALFDTSPFAVAPKPNPAQAASASPSMPQGSQGRDAPMNATTKMASALFSNIDRDDVKNFVEDISKQEDLKNAYDINPVFSESLHRMVAGSTVKHSVKTASAPEEFSSAVISKTSGGFIIKTSSALSAGRTVKVSNKEAQLALPVEIRQQVIKTGSALMVPDGNEGLPFIEDTEGLSIADKSGVYAVMTKTGSSQRAAVITEVTRIDGTTSDACLVVGKSGASYQEKVAGVRCGDVETASLEGQEPKGEGVFIFKSAGIVMEPVEVLHTIYEGDQTTFAYTHPLRGLGHLKVASVNKVVSVDDSTQLIPDDFAFIPLSFGVRYSDDATAMNKIASRNARINTVSLIGNGGEFSFRGGRIDEEALSNLSMDDTLLALSDMGDTADGAYEKIAMAASGKTAVFQATMPQKVKVAEADNSDAVELTNLIKGNFVKEAATFTNAETVDAVLSLNFITPENVAGYIDSIPTFEESTSKLAELLIGVRLGLSDVPEAAVSSALGGMERAITGLKKLQVRANMVV